MEQANAKDVGKHYLQTKTNVMLGKCLEFIETSPAERKLETSMSQEDQKLMKILQEGTKLRNGHH